MATHLAMEITDVCYHVRLCHMDSRARTQVQMLLGAKPRWLIVKIAPFPILTSWAPVSLTF